MNLMDIVALRTNQKILARVLLLEEDDYRATIELVDAPGSHFKVKLSDLVEIGTNEPGMELEGSVNVLGTTYSIKVITEKERGYEWGDGFVDFSTKEIFISALSQMDYSMKDLKRYQRKVLRHEIIHAFFYESGLGSNSHTSENYAVDEELTDWIAIQFPKLAKAFEEAGCND